MHPQPTTKNDGEDVACNAEQARSGKLSYMFIKVIYIIIYVYHICIRVYPVISNLVTKFDGAYTRMLRVALNKSWRVDITNKELCDRIPTITVSIREQRLILIGHCYAR